MLLVIDIKDVLAMFAGCSMAVTLFCWKKDK